MTGWYIKIPGPDKFMCKKVNESHGDLLLSNERDVLSF